MDLDYIAMDKNHIELIYGIIISQKPKKVLEIGIGSGLLTQKILSAFAYNCMEINLDCVDNFFDWSGKIPSHILKLKNINLIQTSEENFINTCETKYDTIISDADHFNSHKWIEKTCALLNDGGILIFHDITNKMFPNLLSIISFFESNTNTYSYVIFNKNSRNDERCDRGLLVVHRK